MVQSEKTRLSSEVLFSAFSVLENEMYQLSHMLTDQKSIIHNMLELSLTGSGKN